MPGSRTDDPKFAPARMRVLLVDDDQSFLQVLKFHLDEDGYETDEAANGEEGLQLFEKTLHPVVVTDLKMPKLGGLDLLRAIKKRSPETLVIVITAFGDMSTAVDAMKAGAFDFLPKPCDRAHLKLTVRRAAEHWSLQGQVRDLRGRLDSAGKELIYESGAMARVAAVADRVARTDTTALILGESGTGKELLARRIHRHSPRSDQAFVALSCGAIPKDLLESELFGHVRGSFTGAVRDRKGRFEQADGGTIFLDEVGELPAEVQLRLLRVLQERVVDVVGRNEPQEVDVRVISATNKNLRDAVDKGEFREDLFFRLAVFPIEIPPLRERTQDIAPLVSHFLARYGGDRRFTITNELLGLLRSQEWRGNVRELENVCQRMVLLAEDDELTAELWGPSAGLSSSSTQATGRTRIDLPPEGISLVDLERDVIERALQMNRYNQTKTAKFLRIPRHVLQYRIEKYQIPLKGRG